MDFYAKVVEDADERDKNNIKILKGGWEEFKAVKRRMKYKWEEKKDDDNDDDMDLSFLYT